MKVLVVHTCYSSFGGEDAVVENEKNLLQKDNVLIEQLIFQNSGYKTLTVLKYLMLLFNPFSFFRTISKINQVKPDVIHVHNLHFAASPSVIWAARVKRIPIVATLHNYRLLCPSAILLSQCNIFIDSIYCSFPWKAIVKKVYRNSYLQTFWLAFTNWFHKKIGTWQMINQFIVLTPFAKQVFIGSHLKNLSDKISVKPNFISAPEPAQHNRSMYFLFVGRLSEEKGIYVLLNGFKNSNLSLKIAGDGPLKNLVLETADIYSNIKYIGNLSTKDVLAEMAQCNALVFPSIWYEGMPMTIIEALACGTPVIASRLGAMEEMIEDGKNGLHFNVGESTDLKNKIDMWVQKPEEEKQHMRESARKSYEQLYTPEVNLLKLKDIYNSVLNAKDGITTFSYN